jgi:hypothetical protein
MPPTTLTAQNIPNGYSATGLTVTESNANPADSNDVVAEDLLFLVVRNSGASGRAFTITSVADAVTGRTGNISATIASGQTRVFRLIRPGFANTEGKIVFNGAHAELKFAVLRP